ncbi:MAG: hypothetical protein U0231_15865 [Nitrospiraceae bacterium]
MIELLTEMRRFAASSGGATDDQLTQLMGIMERLESYTMQEERAIAHFVDEGRSPRPRPQPEEMSVTLF